MRRIALIATALALVLAACGGDEVAERILEGQEGVDDVEIDQDDGEIRIEIEDDEGDVTAVLGGGEIPAGFPIDAPGGGEVQAVIESTNNSSVTIDYPESEFDSLVAFYDRWVTDSGFTLQSKHEVSTDPRLVTWTLEGDGEFYSIAVSDGFGKTVISLVVAEN